MRGHRPNRALRFDGTGDPCPSVHGPDGCPGDQALEVCGRSRIVTLANVSTKCGSRRRTSASASSSDRIAASAMVSPRCPQLSLRTGLARGSDKVKEVKVVSALTSAQKDDLVEARSGTSTRASRRGVRNDVAL